ncbi:MAG TPA: hypothetical protein VG347_11980 [Verrucomicrobiae bacterium]|nr:hypothetical protein [Verrucomicrobiae bacterium]
MKAAATIPAQKIRMMKLSMLSLTLGLLGLLPFIGLFFAAGAGWASGQARLQEKIFWNPAKPQRILGFTCAIIGALLWTFVDVFVAYRIVYGSGQS